MLFKTLLIARRFLKINFQSSAFASCGGSLDKIKERFVLPKRYVKVESVWNHFLPFTLEYKPLNLGQGFPDFPPPDHITKSLKDVTCSDDVFLHQYTREFGHPRLVKAIAELYSKLICREINPFTEVLVTVGGTEALFCTINGHIDLEDEIIVIEPFFDCYEPMVRASGGLARFIPLKVSKEDSSGSSISSDDYKLDIDELSNMFNPKTKAILLNTPNNPLGKVYTECELKQIAELCIKYDVICIADEVYEWLVYNPSRHIRICSLPGMWERTITIGSAGKTFSVTGWKLGWAYGPANLLYNLQVIHQNCIQSCTTPTQEAAAMGFETEMNLMECSPSECYFYSLACELSEKKDFMLDFLCEVGMKPIVPQGGYCMVADFSPLESIVDLSSEKDKQKDYRFAKWMLKNVKLQGIPCSAFYSQDHKKLGENFIRYCYCKKDENLQKGADILRKWASGGR